MDADDLLVTGSRVLTSGRLAAATVAVRGGVVTEVLTGPVPHERIERAGRVVDAGDHVVLPGLVDSHVHVNEPGRTHWEGFATATEAAALGGVTTIVDMPLNCRPPTLDVEALELKRSVAGGKVAVDVAFWGGAVPANLDALAPLHEAGVRGFKAFTCDSGVPEYDHVPPSALPRALAAVAALGSVLLVHAEDPDVCAGAAARVVADEPDRRRHATWLATRPPEAEVAAVRAVVDGVRATGARAHVLHLSAAGAGEVVAEARDEGLPVSAETCPHYLVLAAEDVPDGATEHKCAPPVRDRANADRLWDLLADGVIEAVVSDHSPCPPADKDRDTGDFLAAWGGIASLQLGLPLLWTAAAARGHGWPELARWMSAAPAALAGLAGKGRIAPGRDADLVVVDPDARWRVDGAALAHRHPLTPFHGRDLAGRVVTTVLGGRVVVEDGAVVGPPAGRLL